MDIQQIVQRQHDYFATGATLGVKGRLAALDRLRTAIEKYEGEINDALKADLNKSPFETYMCEVGLVLNELSYIRRRPRRWVRDKRVPTPLSQFKSVSFRHPEPYGVVLVMAPWNYPFMLAMEPVVGAIAAGNCVVMKPSAYSPATSAVMAKLVAETFDSRFFTVVEGGPGREPGPAGPEIRLYLLHRGHHRSPGGDGQGGQAPDPRQPGAGGQEPVYRG